MPESFSLPSFAKINWTLRVLGKRADGFHELFTIFQTISLHDTLVFEKSDRLELFCDDPTVPTDEGNLIIKAGQKLKDLTGYAIKGRVTLVKRIPSPGGLGGGSSNAMTAIFGLLKLNGIRPIKTWELRDLASSLGADVPFFLCGGTATGADRGDYVLPNIAEIDEPYLLVVTPQVEVPTAEAFAVINAPPLTKSDAESILTVCREEASSFDPRLSVLKNEFEASVFDAYPEVGRVKETLLGLGAVNAVMSGSGASVFGIFDNTETRQAAEKALDKESTWRKFAVSTVSRSEYRRALGL